ncbi:hypothetical protein LINPERHAP2_LOCUS13052 [Linum perenne]
MNEDSNPNLRCPKILFSENEIKSFYRPWSRALVVKVLERTFSFGAVKKRLESLWARNGNIQVSDASNSYFLVRFADAADYQRAAFQGPWKIFDYYFSVARWTPCFNEEEPLGKILTWVCLPKLPIHYFNQMVVTRIGNCIGRTVRLDLATSEGARGRYARVCVEVDISKPLLGKYMIDNRTFFVEYESLENICVTCGFYGHKVDCCPTIHTSQSPPGQLDEEVPPSGSIPEGDTGEWMIVQRRSRNKAKKAPVTALESKSSGSRFDPIASSTEKTSQGALPLKPAKETPEKEADDVTAMLASQLAAVLAQAPCLRNVRTGKEAQKGPQPAPRQPLADVSNVSQPASSKISTPVASLGGEENSERLVNVPVIYDNPTFQGSSQAAKTPRVKKQDAKRDKEVIRRGKPHTSTKKVVNNGKQIRSFGPRPLDKDKGAVSKAGRPPDRV